MIAVIKASASDMKASASDRDDVVDNQPEPPPKRMKSSTPVPDMTSLNDDLSHMDESNTKVCMMCSRDFDSVVIENDSCLCETCYDLFAKAHIGNIGVCDCPCCTNKKQTSCTMNNSIKVTSKQDFIEEDKVKMSQSSVFESQSESVDL